MNVESIVSDCSSPCRLCAQTDGGLIDIYSEEGSALDILDKIKQYVPIEISQTDELSTKCCTDCVSKILSWHKFILHIKETSIILKVKAEESRKLSKGGQEDGRKNNGNTTIYSIRKTNEGEVEEWKVDTKIVEKDFHKSTSLEGNIYAVEELSVEKELFDEAIEIKEEDDEVDKRKFDNEILEEIFHNSTSVGEVVYESEELPSGGETSDETGEIIIINPPRKRKRRKEPGKEFFCTICGSSFTRKSDVYRHMKTQHPNLEGGSYTLKGGESIEGDFQQVHSSRANNKDLLDKCRVVENGLKFYECDICKRRIKLANSFVKHRTTHTGIKPYVCHFCGKGFRLPYPLRSHIRLFHEGVKKFKCDVCQRRFGTKSARDEHMNIHSGSRPFACKFCPKTFRHQSGLYCHKIFHFENFKYECNLCGKKFRRSSELVVHDRQHTGEKPYACEVCGKEFRFSQSLNRHRKIHSRKNEELVDSQSALKDV